jgi:hypothetical protein
LFRWLENKYFAERKASREAKKRAKAAFWEELYINNYL